MFYQTELKMNENNHLHICTFFLQRRHLSIVRMSTKGITHNRYVRRQSIGQVIRRQSVEQIIAILFDEYQFRCSCFVLCIKNNSLWKYLSYACFISAFVIFVELWGVHHFKLRYSDIQFGALAKSPIIINSNVLHSKKYI